MASDADLTEADFVAVYQRHITMVRGRARRLLGDAAAAEDIAHEAFLRFLDYRRRGNTEENTAVMLYRIATNLSLNRLRDERRRHELLTAQGSPQEGSAPALDARVDVTRVLASVDDEVAQIAAYYYVDGLEQDEIAEVMAMQRRTVGRRLERFRESALRVLGGLIPQRKEVRRAVP